MWEINNHVHNKTGFWGPVDSNHAFCEPHYSVTPYLAEFYNCASSLVFVALAVSLHYKNDRYIQASQVWLVMIGLGSMLFHGSMKYLMQLCDEIPMVGLMTTILVGKLNAPHPFVKDSPVKKKIFVALTVLFSLCLCACYVVFDQYEIFVHGFTALCGFDLILGHFMKQHERHGAVQNRARFGAIISILLGRVAWESEHQFCKSHPELWPLHVVWHFLSCAAAHYALLFTYLARADKNADLPRWRLMQSKSKRKVV